MFTSSVTIHISLANRRGVFFCLISGDTSHREESEMIEISGKYASAIAFANDMEEYAIAQIRQICD